MKRIENPWTGLAGYRCFGCAPGNPAGLHLEFYEDGDDIVAFWTPDPCFQGWLDTLHGGIQCTLLDELAGWIVTRKMQTAGMTARLDTRFLKPVRIGAGRLTIRGRIREVRRNAVFIETELYNAAGDVCTRAEALYMTVSRERAEQAFHFHECVLEEEIKRSDV